MQEIKDVRSPAGLDLLLLISTSLFLYLLLFRLPFYPFFYEADQLIFLYNADRMLDGELMYRDFFQFTFPGGQVLYLLLFTIFGAKYWVLPFAILLMGLGYCWFLLRSAQLLVPGYLAYLPALIFIFFGFRWFGQDGSHRMFSPLFVLIGVFILLKGKDIWHWVAVGACCALASYFTQQRGIIAVGAFGLFLLTDSFLSEWKWRDVLLKSFALGLGFAITLAALCSYFIFTAGFDAFVNATLTYPSLYYHYQPDNSLGGFWVGFKQILSTPGIGPVLSLLPASFYGFIIPIVFVAFLIVYFLDRKKFEYVYWRDPLLLAIVSGVFLISTTNPGHLRYYQISPTFLILLSWLIWHLKLFGGRNDLVVKTAAVLMIIFSGIQIVRLQTGSGYVRIDTPRGTVYSSNIESTKRYVWIAERTKPGDLVFEASNPYIYFPFALKNPSAYAQFYQTAYTRPEFVAEAVEDLKKKPTRFILWSNDYNLPDEQRVSGDHLGPLAEYVQTEYEPVGPVYMVDGKPIQVWQKRGSEPEH
ncbi:MAG: hypothetical protein KF685_13810 [Acidobacteria bacterium]|nr:hypothetical protein [Acidobacteriota bacterium]